MAITEYWSAAPPRTFWSATLATTAISAQATQWVVSNVSLGPEVAASVSPTAASVSFAFVGPYNTAQQALDQTVASSTTFYTGSWAGITAYPTVYVAQAMVGPSSNNVTLTTGSYAVWLRIGGSGVSPENPIILSGALNVS